LPGLVSTKPDQAQTESKNVSAGVRLNNIIDGVESDFPATATLTINGVTYDKPGLLAALRAQAAPFDLAEAAAEALKEKLAAREAATPGAEVFVKQVGMGLLVYYGTNTSTLAAYGVSPPKARRQATAEELMRRAAKAKKTRELRGTKGAKQKASIKAVGSVTVTTSLDSPPAAQLNGSAPDGAAH
jgi:hypothetical protein